MLMTTEKYVTDTGKLCAGEIDEKMRIILLRGIPKIQTVSIIILTFVEFIKIVTIFFVS